MFVCDYPCYCVASRTFLFFFFFKQTTAYEMRISDWSSDVCSSDLWNQAQAELQQVGASIAALNTLASQVSGTASLSAFLLESTSTTFELRGAVEEDHRQLAVLEDEVNKTVVVIDRLLNEQIGRASGRERVCQYV